MKRARVGLAALLALAPAAQACGVCIDDKVAATYDHAVVERALERRQVMVFAEVKGPGEAAARVRAAKAAAGRVRGVDASSVRAASEPATISFAFDPRRGDPARAIASMERLGAGVRLELLRVLR